MDNIQKYMRKGKLQAFTVRIPEGMMEAIDSFRSNLLDSQSIQMNRSQAIRHLVASNPVWSNASVEDGFLDK